VRVELADLVDDHVVVGRASGAAARRRDDPVAAAVDELDLLLAVREPRAARELGRVELLEHVGDAAEHLARELAVLRGVHDPAAHPEPLHDVRDEDLRLPVLSRDDDRDLGIEPGAAAAQRVQVTADAILPGEQVDADLGGLVVELLPRRTRR
jgi:hypothetical protein